MPAPNIGSSGFLRTQLKHKVAWHSGIFTSARKFALYCFKLGHERPVLEPAVRTDLNQIGTAFPQVASIEDRSDPAVHPVQHQREGYAASASLKAAADAWGIAYTTRLTVRTASGHVTYNSYVRVRTLGRGSSGAVELCADRRSGQLRALKLISRKRQRRLALIRARSLAAMAPPGVAPSAAVDDLTDVAQEVDALGRLSALQGVINVFEVIGGCRRCLWSSIRHGGHCDALPPFASRMFIAVLLCGPLRECTACVKAHTVSNLRVCTADDRRQPEVVLVLEYVEGPRLVSLAPDGTCKRLSHPVTQRLFATTMQVSMQLENFTLSFSASRCRLRAGMLGEGWFQNQGAIVSVHSLVTLCTQSLCVLDNRWQRTCMPRMFGTVISSPRTCCCPPAATSSSSTSAVPSTWTKNLGAPAALARRPKT